MKEKKVLPLEGTALERFLSNGDGSLIDFSMTLKKIMSTMKIWKKIKKNQKTKEMIVK